MALPARILALVALLALVGCLGLGTIDPPPAPDHPETLTADRVADYANASETTKRHRAAADRGATEERLACGATTLGTTDRAGYAFVGCSGGFSYGDQTGTGRWQSVYRVTTSSETRIGEGTVTRRDGGDGRDDRNLALRVYSFAEEGRTVTVTLEPVGPNASGDATTDEFSVGPDTGVYVSAVADDPRTDAYRVTATLDTGESVTFRWDSGERRSLAGTVPVVVVTSEGSVVGGVAPVPR
ncbi:hypothetical protein [Halomarina litorea]|uniref:hypothetical protein n=1 Tax=Halomarina litorea TaxID=2961595 RepID=UPI0020C2970D|nr:hypothetical protein [Halomarina sp. BCD28]